MKKYKLFFFAAVFLLLFCFRGREAHAAFYYPPDEDGRLVVVIDPGHGGTNLGAEYNGFLEKEMNMAVAKAMYEELSLYEDITVYLTHDTAENSMTIQERADFAASVHADFVFCLHFNMSAEQQLFGSEVWISAFGEENRQGYRFGILQLTEMQSMGLSLRGVKTRLNEEGQDYYGILRFCEEYGIPAALIEHCHLDNERDTPFYDEEEDLIAFGRADATAAAKFFGLKSEVLGVDYGAETKTALTEPGSLYARADTTPPDICTIEQAYTDLTRSVAAVTVTACDYDSSMLYYAYSIDGGKTFTPYLEWPEADLLSGTAPDTFTFEAEIPDGVSPFFVVRAVNQYDLVTESNLLTGFPVFTENTVQETAPQSPEAFSAVSEDVSSGSTGAGFQAHAPKDISRDHSFGNFLFICLIIMAVLFVTLLLFSILQTGKKRRKRKRNRKR